MRPWEREPDTPPPDSPPWQPKGSLSSLVVRPPGSVDDGGGDVDVDVEAEEPRVSERRHRDELSHTPPRRGRSQRSPDGSVGCTCSYGVKASTTGYGVSADSVSPSHQQRTGHLSHDVGFNQPDGPEYYRDEFRGGNDVSRFQDFPPTYQHGRGRGNLRDVSPPYGRGRGGGRFFDRSPMYGRGRGRGRFREPAYGRGRGRGGGRFQDFPATYEHEEGRGRFLDISPTYERGRGGGRFRDSLLPFERDRDARRFDDLSPVFGREKNGGRYRDISPPYDHGRDARLFERDFDDIEPEPLSFRDEGGIRNNPNIAPREGDWFCKNPSCRNLNFARREYCNNCNKHRYGAGRGTPSGSPRQRVPRDIHISVDLGPRREPNGYRSPPHSLARDGPREPRGFPVPRHGGRFPDSPIPRDRADYNEDFAYRASSKIDRLLTRDWDPRRRGRGSYDLSHERRGYDRDHWIQEPRERSRTPRRVQPLPKHYPRDSFMGRGRGYRRGMGSNRRGLGRSMEDYRNSG